MAERVPPRFGFDVAAALLIQHAAQPGIELLTDDTSDRLASRLRES